MTTVSARSTEWIELPVAGSTAMRAVVVRPASRRAKTPGLLLFQDAYGVNAQLIEIAERFAGLGCTVIAPELYHRTMPGLVGAYDGSDDALRARGKADLSDAGIVADIHAAYDWLAGDGDVAADRTAAVGFCMGGRTVYLANSELPLRAAVSFYGGNIAPGLLDRAPAQHGRLLMFWGGRDAHITAAHRGAVADALTAADKDHTQVVFARAAHGFFGHHQPPYDPASAQAAWGMTVAFLGASGVLT
jgi:carboxymethylenebutenolidase